MNEWCLEGREKEEMKEGATMMGREQQGKKKGKDKCGEYDQGNRQFGKKEDIWNGKISEKKGDLQEKELKPNEGLVIEGQPFVTNAKTERSVLLQLQPSQGQRRENRNKLVR